MTQASKDIKTALLKFNMIRGKVKGDFGFFEYKKYKWLGMSRIKRNLHPNESCSYNFCGGNCNLKSREKETLANILRAIRDLERKKRQ